MIDINETFCHLNVGLPEDIARLKAWGDITEAVRLIDLRLAGNLPAPLRACMTAEREIMLRLAGDFPYSYEEALHEAQSRLADFTAEEFASLVERGRIDWIYLKGEKRYFRRFVNTLIHTDSTMRERNGKSIREKGGVELPPASVREELLERARSTMRERGEFANRFRIRASVKIKDEAFEKGKLVKVHIPLPAACLQQSEIELHAFSDEPCFIAPEDAPQRTIYFERVLEENRAFFVEYSYVHTARWCDPSAIKADAGQPTFFLEEQAPHIAFTPYLRALAAKLTQGVGDPVEKARRIYGYITGNVKYSFMPGYFVLENIAENAALNFKGDCGVQALLFITLCRIVGIPARWQSGFAAEPADIGAHDWAMFYVAPHGWLFADPSFGGSAHRAGNEQRRWHYFGNLDPYRMVANSEFQRPHMPPMTHWRADPYDNQLGEVSYEHRSLQLNEFEREQAVIDYAELL